MYCIRINELKDTHKCIKKLNGKRVTENEIVYIRNDRRFQTRFIAKSFKHITLQSENALTIRIYIFYWLVRSNAIAHKFQAP